MYGKREGRRKEKEINVLEQELNYFVQKVVEQTELNRAHQAEDE